MSVLFYRIATSSAGLATGNFVVWGLPTPDASPFRDHTTRSQQGGGGEGRHGHNNAEILWNRLTAELAKVIQDLIETAEVTGGQGNGTLHATLPKGLAKSDGASWIDISGVAIMPQWEPTRRLDGLAYDNVILRLNDCTVEADPSTVNF